MSVHHVLQLSRSSPKISYIVKMEFPRNFLCSLSKSISICRRQSLILVTSKRVSRVNAQPESRPPPMLRGSSRQTRLSTKLTTLPKRIDLFFAGNLLRQIAWAVIAFSTGFYSANTVSLSFGALAINDVVAAAITAAFCELCSFIYYSAPRATLKLVFLNAFKMGVIAALIADAFKLGS